MSRGRQRTREDRGTDRPEPRRCPTTARRACGAVERSPVVPLARRFPRQVWWRSERSSGFTTTESAGFVRQKQEYRDDRQDRQDQRGPKRPVIRHPKLVGDDASDQLGPRAAADQARGDVVAHRQTENTLAAGEKTRQRERQDDAAKCLPPVRPQI